MKKFFFNYTFEKHHYCLNRIRLSFANYMESIILTAFLESRMHCTPFFRSQILFHREFYVRGCIAIFCAERKWVVPLLVNFMQGYLSCTLLKGTKFVEQIKIQILRAHLDHKLMCRRSSIRFNYETSFTIFRIVEQPMPCSNYQKKNVSTSSMRKNQSTCFTF